MKKIMQENVRVFCCRLMAEASRSELEYLARDIKDGDVEVIGDINAERGVLFGLWSGAGYYVDRFLVMEADEWEAGNELAKWLRKNDEKGHLWYDTDEEMESALRDAEDDGINDDEKSDYAHETFFNQFYIIGEGTGYEVAVLTENLKIEEISAGEMETIRELLK